jgi:DNA modification methylase
MFNLYHGDCLDRLRELPDNSVDSIVTDPPYGLSFMGRKWDYDVPSVEIWEQCLRVLKPGGHLLAFAGTRTQHRMAVRIEDAGFEIRDLIAWVYGTGFPKSMDVSKAIDKQDATELRRERALRFTAWIRSTGLTAARIDEITGTNMGSHYTTAASQPTVATREYFEMLRPHFGQDVPEWIEELVTERTVESENFKAREVIGRAEGKDTATVRPGMPLQDGTQTREYDITAPATEAAQKWHGWGTALKPSLEPVTVARKPLAGTVAATVLEFGTGAINIDGCRIGSESTRRDNHGGTGDPTQWRTGNGGDFTSGSDAGRWPANLIHDGSPEVVALFPDSDGAGASVPNVKVTGYGSGIGTGRSDYLGGDRTAFDSGTGSAARFFYAAKASTEDRNAGLEEFAAKAAGEVTGGRQEGSAGLNSPRAGAGRTSGAKNIHPTVKPTDLMRYLCRLVTPPGGVVLDPFMGSGSTGRAAILEGFRFIGIEREAEYLEIARARISAATATPEEQAAVKAKDKAQLDLFASAAA